MKQIKAWYEKDQFGNCVLHAYYHLLFIPTNKRSNYEQSSFL